MGQLLFSFSFSHWLVKESKKLETTGGMPFSTFPSFWLVKALNKPEIRDGTLLSAFSSEAPDNPLAIPVKNA